LSMALADTTHGFHRHGANSAKAPLSARGIFRTEGPGRKQVNVTREGAASKLAAKAGTRGELLATGYCARKARSFSTQGLPWGPRFAPEIRSQGPRERKSFEGTELRAAGYHWRTARMFRTRIFFERADITHMMRTAALPSPGRPRQRRRPGIALPADRQGRTDRR
jgi:hypothetical protein